MLSYFFYNIDKADNIDAIFFYLQVELVPGGASIAVTPSNVYEYVRKYAEYRMLIVAEQPMLVGAS